MKTNKQTKQAIASSYKCDIYFWLNFKIYSATKYKHVVDEAFYNYHKKRGLLGLVSLTAEQMEENA